MGSQTHSSNEHSMTSLLILLPYILGLGYACHLEKNKDYPGPGNDLRELIVSDSERECAKECYNDVGCNYWSFSTKPGENKCWLKTGKTNVKESDIRISGDKACGGGCFKEQRIDYPGGDIPNREPFKHVSEDTCAKNCFNEDKCNFWSYSSSTDGGTCWLKETKGKNGVIEGNSDRISGNKACGA